MGCIVIVDVSGGQRNRLLLELNHIAGSVESGVHPDF
jgi:hypothetical protein